MIRLAALAVLAGLALQSFRLVPQDPKDYTFTKKGAVSPDKLAEEIQATLGIQLTGKDQHGYFEITHGEKTTVRIVMLARALTDNERRRIQEILDAHQGVAPTGEPAGGSKQRREQYRARYKDAKTDAERIQVLAECMGLADPK